MTEPADGWIRVTDRLPERAELVLFWTGVCVRFGALMDNGVFWSSSSNPWYEVTHWMPLPAPPKETTHAR